MNIDWPHMIATMVVIFVVFIALERIGAYRNATRGKRFAPMAVTIFVALTVLNLIWPYGA